MRSVLIAAAAVLAFLAILLVRLPASWALRAARGALTCAVTEGTLWEGSCSGLGLPGQPAPLGDLSWRLHPRNLLRGELAARVDLAHGPIDLHGELAVNPAGRVRVTGLQLALPLDPAYVPHLPPGLRGRAQARIASARIEQHVLAALVGHIEAHDLIERTGTPTALGSYTLDFPGGSGEPTGSLKDLGDGPLAVSGTLRLTHEPGFALDGLVAARPAAPPELIQQLQFLGTPDAQGRRSFSMAGTF